MDKFDPRETYIEAAAVLVVLITCMSIIARYL